METLEQIHTKTPCVGPPNSPTTEGPSASEEAGRYCPEPTRACPHGSASPAATVCVHELPVMLVSGLGRLSEHLLVAKSLVGWWGCPHLPHVPGSFLPQRQAPNQEQVGS